MLKATIDELRNLLIADVDGKIPYDEVRERFEQVDTSKYGHSMPTWVPDFEAVHKLVYDAIAATASDPAQILELGAGTGRVTKQLLERFPNTHVTALDNSANMLTAVQAFPDHWAQRTTALEGDFFSDQLALPASGYDALVSVFAICHGRRDEDYRQLYRRMFDWVKPGGCVVCFDHVASSNNALFELAFKEWDTLLSQHFDDETIHEIIISTIKEDYPRPIYTHLQLMAEAGFTQLDVLWKKGIFGVYFASKPV